MSIPANLISIGSLELDASKKVPTLALQSTIRGLDYDRLFNTFGLTDMIKGRGQLITLHVKSRGTSFQDVLGKAHGQMEIVDGPLQLTNEQFDLWAAGLISTALVHAWEKEPFTQLNCTVGYFDLVDGQVQSDAILIDTTRITIAGIGTLDLRTEELDLILTPLPKNPALVSLAHTVRLTGPLSRPEVSDDRVKISKSEGWSVLDLANPLDWVLAIPKVTGTSAGTFDHNPCVEAMASKRHTAKTVATLHQGFFEKIGNWFKSFGDSQETPSGSQQMSP